jgi:RimJ/RimL family protein N-acetyltransferase
MSSSEVFLRGEGLSLRPLRPSDADGPYPGWLNDPVVCEYNSHHVFPYHHELALQYITNARTTRAEIILAIEDDASGCHIGNIALQRINLIDRTAEFSILLGDREFWGKGVGRRAGRPLLRHGFDAVGLNRIGCGTSSDNQAMRRLATRLGMREEGVRRAAIWKNGRFVDIVEYGVLAEEFRASERP